MYGVFLLQKGFAQWNKKHQVYIDAEIKWKGEIYQKLLNNEEEKQKIIYEIIQKNTPADPSL